MGWYGESIDVEIQGEIVVKWTCPRCDFINCTKVNNAMLKNGDWLYCQNEEVCGDGQSYVMLGGLNPSVSYKC